MAVVLVARENIAPLWPQTEPLVKSAIGDIPTHTADDVLQALLGGGCQLWAQWNDRLEAIAVTEFAHYPRGTWLRVWLMSALPGVKFDTDEFWNVLDAWREANDCRGLEGTGRLGFLRRFPCLKFEGAVMRSVVQ